MLRYLATALLIWVAAPDFNKQPDTQEPTETVVAYQVQLVQEIDEPQVSKQEEVQTISTPPTQVKPKQTGCEAYRAEIEKYDWNANIAMAIMKAESGCRTTAVGDNYPIGGLHAPSCGLFQVRTLKGRPTCNQLQDPATNIAWAYKLYGASGWKPWSVYNKGLYKEFM